MLWFTTFHMTILLGCIVMVAIAMTAAGETDILQETDARREARIAWWRDAKFGLFIHWGPSSVSGKEISWARKGHPADHAGMETIERKDYDVLYKSFNPTGFNADEWMKIAKAAGMKYVVFTTKHHDGFSNWDTKLSDYRITAKESPFGRDICKELAQAAHKQGLRLGWYYSTRDWYHPDYLQGDNRKYDEFYRGQVRELLSNYGKVDILWFDHISGNWKDYDLAALFKSIKSLQPDILVNNRAARWVFPPKDKPGAEIGPWTEGDFDTPEQTLGAFQFGRAWESCITLTQCDDGGGWSYRPDGRTRTFDETLRMLLSCAAGDGNLLLNVGPLPNGKIAPDQVAVLAQMGQWLNKYGQSVYGTRGGPFKPSNDVLTTHKGKTLYVHILHNKDVPIMLGAIKKKIVQSRLLTGGSVEVKQTDTGIAITIPKQDRRTPDTIVELELDGPAGEIAPR